MEPARPELPCGGYAALAVKAFGPNLPRLARLKHTSDPGNVLAYACPLPKAPMEQKLIVLVTGESCAGKDYCADVWVSVLTSVLAAHRLKARAEEHRPALSRYFKAQVRQRPRLPEEVFLRVVDEAVDAHVLFITGMRDEAPVPSLSHLVPGSRLLEVRVEASREQRQLRRGHGHADDEDGDKDGKEDGDKDDNSRPSFIFINESTGSEAATTFSQRHLLPLFDEQLRRLASMVRSVPDFPRPAIEFRHVLDISQQPGGLATCTSLLQSHFAGDWAKVDAVACCEIGGLVYASALAARVHVPLALIREAGKLPPPTVSVVKAPSHVSARASEETRFEMGCHVVPRGASVVVVDDVLATGKTLCAVLQLLRGAGIRAGDVSVMVVAEFPLHRGRQLLRSHGFGGVEIRSLLVFDGV
ncbi:hypothetical protein G6O67_002017 [Ophiocordyceps sinensis]|uniref:adenine phosphoribosyltransferase n=1 Tax=Ophiocordyceps sinensis TaxID=72228 RepID=A0A8H4PTE0_9HYPO|nr:hypothetical protein G6O67_002017 [Ophiocordyceps sinensis]